nr:MAG TPA: hypothetical protein [Caudoviricetes sp.]
MMSLRTHQHSSVEIHCSSGFAAASSTHIGPVMHSSPMTAMPSRARHLMMFAWLV